VDCSALVPKITPVPTAELELELEECEELEWLELELLDEEWTT